MWLSANFEGQCEPTKLNRKVSMIVYCIGIPTAFYYIYHSLAFITDWPWEYSGL